KVAIEWVNDFFKDHEESKKIILYAHHLDVIDTLKEGLRHHGIFTIDGRVPAKRRAALIKGFQNGARPRVAVINKAGGEGIDLFGKGNIDSSTILFVERQWTPALEEQAIARLDRIGQSNPVTAYYLLAIGTFDSKMDIHIARKRKILDDIVGMEEIEMDVTSEVINGMV
ncbi:MAG: C-terminal helicase domain-containing protein, partial [Nitrosopumilus sp.]